MSENISQYLPWTALNSLSLNPIVEMLVVWLVSEPISFVLLIQFDLSHAFQCWVPTAFLNRDLKFLIV